MEDKYCLWFERIDSSHFLNITETLTIFRKILIFNDRIKILKY